MQLNSSFFAEIRWQLREVLVIAKKNAMVYYLKPPVVTFGIVFPFFFYLAFAAGHKAPMAIMVPGIVAMALFFTASAVGPLVTPWERQARTYERLVTSPASLSAIVGGDVLAGGLFGMLLSLVPLAGSVAFTSAQVSNPASLVLGLVLGALAFSALGVLLAAPATEGPSQVMMLSNLVRLPLMFVSGVFIPHADMPRWGQWLSPLSPLSYCSDLVRIGFGEKAYWSVAIDAIALSAFMVAFVLMAVFFHYKTRDKFR
jgi:ABC-2 type transport system permease protein